MLPTKRPGVLAVRAVNQYRRRDVLPYLALRYYLANVAARSDDWVNDVVINTILSRSDPTYVALKHYKDESPDGRIEHRTMHLPDATESLAEAALLAECSRAPHVFGPSHGAVSYRLCQGADRTGMFEHYVNSLAARQHSIERACRSGRDYVVVNTDIRRFYPSICTSVALSIWDRACERARLEPKARAIGQRFLEWHALVGDNKMLTGPMFSHLIGNLVLADIDESAFKNSRVAYCRYVDDISFIGLRDDVLSARKELEGRLADSGFELHPADSAKHIEVTATEWLTSRNDFGQSQNEVSWASFVGSLKRFLLREPAQREELAAAFRSEGFRIPLLDYEGAIREATFLERLRELAARPWFRGAYHRITISSLLEHARVLRDRLAAEFTELLDGIDGTNQFQRKRRVPKLRYRAGRLVYLASRDDLACISRSSAACPELRVHSRVCAAVASGDIDPVIPMGANVAQVAAQAMRADARHARMASSAMESATESSIAVFLINGVHIDVRNGLNDTEMIRFATEGSNSALMKSESGWIRSTASLHGLGESARHAEMIDSAFDMDERLTMDALDQLHVSGSL